MKGRLGAGSLRLVAAAVLVLVAALGPGPLAVWGALDERGECSAEDRKRAGKLRSQGDDALMAKRFRDAIKLYGDAIHAEPDNEKNYYKRYRAFDKVGDSQRALADLNAALAIKPDYTSAYAFRGRTYLNQGLCVEALADFETVLRQKPTHGDAKKLLPAAKECAAVVSQADAFMRQRKWDLAEAKINEALELTGKAVALKLKRAQTRFHQHKFYECVADAGEVLKTDPDSLDALLYRGLGYYYASEHEMALRHFREGLKRDPEHADLKGAYKRLGRIVKLAGKGEAALKRRDHDGLLEALAHFADALAVDERHVDFTKTMHSKICSIHATLKDVPAARKACEEAIRIDAGMLDPYVTLADLLLRVASEPGDFEEAVRAWQRAQEAHRDSQQVREGLHKAQVALKQSKQKNYYKILGIARDAETSVVKKAYRKLAMTLHPDKHVSKDEEEQASMAVKFQLVAEAYEVLASEELRGKYDRGEDVFENQGHDNRRGGGFPFGGFRHQQRWRGP